MMRDIPELQVPYMDLRTCFERGKSAEFGMNLFNDDPFDDDDLFEKADEAFGKSSDSENEKSEPKKWLPHEWQQQQAEELKKRQAAAAELEAMKARARQRVTQQEEEKEIERQHNFEYAVKKGLCQGCWRPQPSGNCPLQLCRYCCQANGTLEQCPGHRFAKSNGFGGSATARR